MADLIAPNSNDPQEMAKQVEAIAEAAAQHDEQVAQLLNLVPKAAALSTAASRAINFTKKDWVDTPTSGTPITAADMNRIEQAIVDLNTTLTSVQNSLSHVPVLGSGIKMVDITYSSGRPVLRIVDDNGWIYHFITSIEFLEYYVCRENGTDGHSWRIVP